MKCSLGRHQGTHETALLSVSALIAAAAVEIGSARAPEADLARIKEQIAQQHAGN